MGELANVDSHEKSCSKKNATITEPPPLTPSVPDVGITWKEKAEEYEKFEADYAEAIKQGEAPVAYSRVMFLGPGGSGKSSLLDGLMQKPLRPAESTALADILNIKYQWVEAGDAAEDAWRAMTEEDEYQELASLCRLSMKSKNDKDKDEVPQGAPASPAAPIPTADTTDQYAQMTIQIQKEVTKSVAQISWQQQQEHQEQPLSKEEQELQPSEQGHLCYRPEIMMRIWDCGGQPAFLDILSAFLTTRTMFLLFFDASLPLNSNCQECWRHKGHTYKGQEQKITFLQLMMQWMRLIHASLMAKNEIGIAVEETTTGPAGPTMLPSYPRIMIVGTHGDRISSIQKEQVLEELELSCEEKAFEDLLVHKLIIDNTTAGIGKAEDPGYHEIRKTIYKFTQSLTTQTPLAWLSFRKVVQKKVVDSPLMSLEEVTTIAETCGISKSVIPSVLNFYHQLGVFLHYKDIQSLSMTIIVEPRWLAKQLCLLLMPEWYRPRSPNLAHLWRWLKRKGVLLEELFQDIWQHCGLKGGAQALVDLLEYFNLAKKIDTNTVPDEMQRYNGAKYFVPCMLPAQLEEGSDEETKEPKDKPQKAIRKAATLHITFDTKYVPPGFFVRLAACMTNSEKCTPNFQRRIYRDSITFCYEGIDRITITESKSLASVQVDMIRIAKCRQSVRFADSCVSFRRELHAMCINVMRWWPPIKFNFAFSCNCSSDAGEHFTTIGDATYRNSHMNCHEKAPFNIDQEHKLWLLPEPLAQQPNMVDAELTDIEMKNVTKGLKKIENGISKLAWEMEVEHNPEETDSEYAMILDWVMHKKGTRYKLAIHLRETGFEFLSNMLLKGSMNSPPDSHSNQMRTSTVALQRHDKPSLPLLLTFPVKTTEINIIQKIGENYRSFGTLLLEDEDFAITGAIAAECKNNAYDINFEVLKQWIKGKGKIPVTWETLIQVLKAIKLTELAKEIDSCLQ